MTFFTEALKWATRASGAPGVAKLLGQGTQVADKAAPLAKGLAPVGMGLNIIGGAVGGANAAEGFASGDHDAGWTGVGQVANSAIGAATAGTPFGAAWAGMRLLGDATGWAAGEVGGDDAAFSANEMMGGNLRGLFGDESVGSDVAESLGGGFLGHAAGTVVNLTPAGMVANSGDNLMGGVVNTLGNMFDDDEGVEDDYWGSAKDGISEGASDAWDWVTDW